MTEMNLTGHGAPLPDAESILETLREPVLALTSELRVKTVNRAYCRTFQVKREDTEGRLLYDLGNRQWDIPALRKPLEEILPQNTSFDDFKVVYDFPSIGRKVLLLNARRIHRE